MFSLKPGSRGVEVKQWQDFLIRHGLLGAHDRTSVLSRLLFDKQTAAATVKFQRTHGLEQTGEVDYSTMAVAKKMDYDPHQFSGDTGASAMLDSLAVIEIIGKRYDSARHSVFASEQTFNGKDIPTPDQVYMIVLASRSKPDDAAMVAAIWAKETNFSKQPYGDAGPAQFTSWWLWSHPELIVGDAYGGWKYRVCDPAVAKNRQPRCKDGNPFDGSTMDNLLTLGNVVRFSRKAYPSERQIPHNYNHGDNVDEYTDEVMRLYTKYRMFFRLMLDK